MTGPARPMAKPSRLKVMEGILVPLALLATNVSPLVLVQPACFRSGVMPVAVGGEVPVRLPGSENTIHPLCQGVLAVEQLVPFEETQMLTGRPSLIAVARAICRSLVSALISLATRL